MNQKPSHEKGVQPQVTLSNDDVQAELKIVVKDVKKKLTYEELDEPCETKLEEQEHRPVRNSSRIAARQEA
jgi:hypothetical protein